MSIGSVIKKLRREKDITQEQLAEYLGITSRAVSQWECDRTAPDISQLPLLAHIFDVTTDTLLEVDIQKNEEKISAICDEAQKFYAQGDFSSSAEILRNGLKSFPKSYKLMVQLADSTHGNESIELCEKVISECTDNDLRDFAFELLVLKFKNVGKRDEAVRIARKMSHTWASQEDMLVYLLEGDEAREHLVEYIKFCSGRLMICLNALVEHSDYSVEEKISLSTQCVNILELLYPDGDYNFSAQFAVKACEDMAKHYAELKDANGTLKALEMLCKYAVHFVTYSPDNANTSPAVRGYCDGGAIPSADGNLCAVMLEEIESEKLFDFVRSEECYKTIADTLRMHAK